MRSWVKRVVDAALIDPEVKRELTMMEAHGSGQGLSEVQVKVLVDKRREHYRDEALKVAREHLNASLGKAKGPPSLATEWAGLNPS
jgi:hypothetical protein